MTNQEAIEEIKRWTSILMSAGSKCVIETAEAQEMAIQVLEKQIPKKPNLCMNEKSGMFVDYADGHGKYKVDMNNWRRCPCCNEVVGQRVIAHKHIHDQRKKKYCENCGQAIDWS